MNVIETTEAYITKVIFRGIQIQIFHSFIETSYSLQTSSKGNTSTLKQVTAYKRIPILHRI